LNEERVEKFNGKLAISRKRWKLRQRLLITNRKCHTPGQTR